MGARQIDRGAPRLGADSRDVLQEAGFADAEIDALMAAKVTAAAAPSGETD